jgi:hypothetical protein
MDFVEYHGTVPAPRTMITSVIQSITTSTDLYNGFLIKKCIYPTAQKEYLKNLGEKMNPLPPDTGIWQRPELLVGLYKWMWAV